ncbi:MAG TPA: hypothetical protein VFU63_09105 [Ktedonobacterales bacterium]|nr:hypothetical protein [Ktedonobacterales bacterium]
MRRYDDATSVPNALAVGESLAMWWQLQTTNQVVNGYDMLTMRKCV